MPALPGLTTRRGSWTRLLCMVPFRFWLACFMAFIGSAALAAGSDSGSVPAPPRRAATDDFKDPRPMAAGPLPREWGQFKGVYREGELVTLHYLVRGVEVLDHPYAVIFDGTTFFSRTISVGPTRQPLALRVCDVEGGDGAPSVIREGGIQWLSAGGRQNTC